MDHKLSGWTIKLMPALFFSSICEQFIALLLCTLRSVAREQPGLTQPGAAWWNNYQEGLRQAAVKDD